MRRGIADYLALPSGVVCATAGLATDPDCHRPGKRIPCLVAAGPGRGCHADGGAGTVKQTRQKALCLQ